MTRATPLPEPLPTLAAFDISTAIAAGVTRSRLRASDLIIPTRGVRARRIVESPAAANETPSERMERIRSELRHLANQFAPALTGDQFFSHETGLALIGAPLPYTRAVSRALHVSARHPAGKPRRDGIVGHRLAPRDPARWQTRGLPIEHPARVWRQAAADWRLDDVIAAGDFLVNPRNKLLSLDDLWRERADAGDVPGRVLERALAEIRVGAETAEETALRLALVRAGLPEPELNWKLMADGRFIARLDLAYPLFRVAPEHDGRVHAFDKAQFARDADRWDAIRAQGWHHVRILSHHMRPDVGVAVDKVAEALFNAGWRPGRT